MRSRCASRAGLEVGAAERVRHRAPERPACTWSGMPSSSAPPSPSRGAAWYHSPTAAATHGPAGSSTPPGGASPIARPATPRAAPCRCDPRCRRSPTRVPRPEVVGQVVGRVDHLAGGVDVRRCPPPVKVAEHGVTVAVERLEGVAVPLGDRPLLVRVGDDRGSASPGCCRRWAPGWRRRCTSRITARSTGRLEVEALAHRPGGGEELVGVQRAAASAWAPTLTGAQTAGMVLLGEDLFLLGVPEHDLVEEEELGDPEEAEAGEARRP